MRHLLISLAAAALAAAMAVPFSATAKEKDAGGGSPPGESRGRRHGHRSVPEFDPATVGAIAAVLAGGGVLIARRRKS